MRTPITYYGGKQRLVKELLKLIPAHKLYVEAFMGGGALFFAKEPSQAEIINDLNGNVANFYCVAQGQFDELKKLIDGTLHSRAIYKKALDIYKNFKYANSEKNEPALQAAWSFWVVTNQGFSGKIGSWALARDGKVGKTLANKREGFTKEYAERLKHVQIESKDALEIIRQYDTEDTFFYLDPPYFNSDCGHYKGFSESDFRTLLDKLTTIKGKFLLSSYPSEVLKEYIESQGWYYREKQQKISVTYNTDKTKTEVMVYNYTMPPQSIEQASKGNKGAMPLRKRNERSKQIAHKKMGQPLRKTAATSLEIEEEVRCFAPAERVSTPYEVNVRKEVNPSLTVFKNQSMKNRTNTQRIEGVDPLLSPKLVEVYENKLLYEGSVSNYYVLGKLPQDIGSLNITLLTEEKDTRKRDRVKLDLYKREAVKRYIEQLATMFNQDITDIESDLRSLTDLLEQYRDKQLEQSVTAFYPLRRPLLLMPTIAERESIELLKQPKLIVHIDKLIGQAGVVGEEKSRMLLFVIASTYKSETPLHALIQGSNGSGKSHLINTIGQCLPPEDVMRMARVSSKSFYHYTRNELVNKVLLLQDYEGLDDEAQYAFRELQGNGELGSSTIYKDTHGNLISTIKTVKSHFSSLAATSKSEVYYSNMSLSIIIGVDESESQTDRIIQYQNKKLSGVLSVSQEQKAKESLQNILRCIKPLEVINPYADKIQLPAAAKMLRRLNTHYQAFVKQITLLHQYQRKKDGQGRLIAEPQDLKTACDILFDAIVLKVDDLDPTLRNFYDRMKEYLKQKSVEQSKEKEKDKRSSAPSDTFTQREIRLALNVPKASCFRYMEELEMLEYIERIGGYANRGFKYRMVFWDDMTSIKTKIKAEMSEQLKQIDNAK